VAHRRSSSLTGPHPGAHRLVDFGDRQCGISEIASITAVPWQGRILHEEEGGLLKPALLVLGSMTRHGFLFAGEPLSVWLDHRKAGAIAAARALDPEVVVSTSEADLVEWLLLAKPG
jgi:hypothetical protein